MHERHAIRERFQRLPRQRQGVGVAVDANQPRCTTLEQQPRVTAQTDRAVDKGPAALRLQQSQHLVGQNRNVHRPAPTSPRAARRQIPKSDSTFASSSVNGSAASLVTRRSWFQTSR